jgi:hypothetical protein
MFWNILESPNLMANSCNSVWKLFRSSSNRLPASFLFHGTDAVDVTLVTWVSAPHGSPRISTRSHGCRSKPQHSVFNHRFGIYRGMGSAVVPRSQDGSL